MSRQLLIFARTQNFEIIKSFKEAYPTAKFVFDETEIIKANQDTIVVIFSQMNFELQEQITCEYVFYFVGVRTAKGPMSRGLYFDTLVAFQRQLAQIEQKGILDLKSQYIKDLGNLTTADADYLRQFEPELIAEIKPQKKLTFPKIFKRENNKFVNLIAVMGEPILAIELIKKMSQNSTDRMLLVEGDLLRPKLDDYLGIRKIDTPIESHLTGIDNTGINIALDALKKGSNFTSGLKDIVCQLNGFDCLLGNYNGLNYEHYEQERLAQLISQCTQLYDTVVVSTGENLYDFMTIYSLKNSNFNIICVEDRKWSIRWAKQMLKMLQIKQNMYEERFLIVNKRTSRHKINYSDAVLRALFKKQYIGTIVNRHKVHAKILNQLMKRIKK